jgi:3-isopropylmalate/(R)-2-methylmalate dehydratase small subunit
MTPEELLREGKVWLFAEDNINTDLIMPAAAFKKSVEEQVKMIFSDYRPGWVEQVEEGDILIGGRNFGTGSSRPGAQLLKLLGIGALVAESINGLFYRNCVNYALPAMECPGITQAVSERDVVRVDVREGEFANLSTNETITGEKMHEYLIGIIEAGGVFEMLKKEGYVS